MFELVSVVIPNYNNELYLPACLDSILLQDHRDLEIIIVDDASTDSSVDILQKYNDEHPNINVIFSEKNLGVAESRHIAIMHSKGDYITSIDSDDYYLNTDKISSELSLLTSNAHDGQAIAFSGVCLVDSGGVMRSVSLHISEGDIFDCVITRSCMIPRDYMFTKRQYHDAGGFDKDIPLYEDWDLKIRLARNNLFFYTGKDGIAYRRHGEGLSSIDESHHVKWLNYIFNKNVNLIDADKLCKTKDKFKSNCIDPLDMSIRNNNRISSTISRIIGKVWKHK